jgi:hypothetical protein
MSDFLISLVRTWVPVGVGAVLSYLASLGVEWEPDTEAAVGFAAVAVITALYYWGARALETRWPVFGLLLGARKAPTYDDA